MKIAPSLAVLMFLAITSIGPAFAEVAKPAADPVVAIVNGENILKSEMQANLRQLPPQVQQLPLEAIYSQLLEQMVMERIVRKAGYDAGLDSTSEVKARMKEMEKKVVADEFLRRETKKRVTDAELKAKYDTYAASFKGEPEVRASHILVKTEKEAQEIIKQVKGGADFAKLSAEKSIDKGAAAQGGDLGYFSKGQMVPEFEKAAFAMRPGDISAKPVKTDFGYHVIKLVDARTSAPESFEKMKPELEGAASQEAAKQVVKELMQKAAVERFGMDGKPLPAPATK